MYARGKYGIEYTPPAPKPENSWIGRIVALVVLVAILLAIRAIWKRVFAHPTTESSVALVTTDANTESTPPTPTITNDAPKTLIQKVDYGNRPVKVRNLLLRLSEAEHAHNVEMAISTIEQLRNTPGTADLDDALARRLGTLNIQRLFQLKSALWTETVKVKRGDSATRIAYEHGSTLASLIHLNSGIDVDKIKIGQALTVMNHPRFNLIISRRTRTADLSLNGKFFKRYYLTDEVKGSEGTYKLPARFRDFCTEQEVAFKPLDRAELEMLLPKGTAAFIREI